MSMKCAGCDTPIPLGAAKCPMCGAPTNTNNSQTPKEATYDRITNPRQDKVQKSYLIKKFAGLVITLAVLITIVAYYKISSDNKKYLHECIRVYNAIVFSNQVCTDTTSTISDIWRKSIDRGSDFSTDIYDFTKRNDASLVNALNKLDARNGMDRLQNPPTKYNTIYLKLLELYGIYKKVESQAKSPTGSLQTFNQQINSMQNEFTKVSEELRVIIPDYNFIFKDVNP